jgi:hypothetical protein
VKKLFPLCVFSALLAACGNKYATPTPPDWVDPALAAVAVQIDGRSCERGCRTFRLEIHADGMAIFSGQKVERVEKHDDGTTRIFEGEFEIVRRQTSPQRYKETLALLDEIDLFDVENAQYFEGPKIERRHCREREPILSATDPRDIRQVGLNMGCPEHVEIGRRLVAALAESAGVTDELGSWPPDEQTSVVTLR